MIANWNRVIANVRVAAGRRGIVIPAVFVAHDHWRESEDGQGGYLLFQDQLLGLLDTRSDNRGPELWQPLQRLLNYAQQRRVSAAIALSPITAERQSRKPSS